MNYWTNSKALSVSNLNEFGDEASKQAIVNQSSNSTDKTYSANYVNNLLEWKYLGSATGTTPIDLPSNFNEIHAIIKNPGNLSTNWFDYWFTKAELDKHDGTLTKSNGHNILWNYNSSGHTIKVENNQINLVLFYANETDVTSECNMEVYYR